MNTQNNLFFSSIDEINTYFFLSAHDTTGFCKLTREEREKFYVVPRERASVDEEKEKLTNEKNRTTRSEKKPVVKFSHKNVQNSVLQRIFHTLAACRLAR